MLDLSSLQKALSSFERALNTALNKEKMNLLDNDQKETIRAGVIQKFEFSYELSWKFIQRWLKENQPEDVELPRTRKDLFRYAAQKGLINNPEKWFEYGDARNLTSHTYNEDKAEIVFEVSIRFLPDAKSLLNQLEQQND